MASFQRVRVRGHSYMRIVESRRVNGKPRVFVLAHLGKADNLLTRLQELDTLRLHPKSHGAVAALYGLAGELDVAGTIDRHLARSGRRDRHAKRYVPNSSRAPERRAGLSVGQSLQLASLGRACHATSKRGFSRWAQTTTLGEVAQVEVKPLTSQHFWDQMDQVPIEVLASIEREIVERAIERFDLSVDTVLYDATNFFTFIASTNTHCELPTRGHNKQKRHDLRQLGVGLLCTREHGIPLVHQMYGGSVPDAKSFSELLPIMRERLVGLGRELDGLTIVYDKGNVSKANQQHVDESDLHYVASLTASSQRSLVEQAAPLLEPVEIDGKETVQAYRTRRKVWGVERTVVVVVSERLRQGQLRGILQHVASAQKWLDKLSATLRRGKQKRDRATIKRDIEKRLMGRQHLRKVLSWELRGRGRKLTLTYQFDQTALDDLARTWLGRLVLMTDRADWSTAEIIRTYRGQAKVEAVFAHMKDPVHVMLRPQYHWTDQKLHVHVFTCVVGYLLARLLHLRAQRAIGYKHSPEQMLDTLNSVHRVTVVRSTQKRSLRVTRQLQDVEPPVAQLLAALGIAD